MHDADAPAIRLTAVRKSYGPVTALRSLDLEIQPGETVALLGPNGAGKSTTVALLLGLATVDAGRVEICGRRPRAAVMEGRIAAMLQDSGFMPGVTVEEIVRLGHSMYPHPLPVGEALELADLTGVTRRRVNRLSGGQAQRLRFALAIVANPEVLILDEPTRALDVTGRTEFWRAMRAYSGTGHTLLFATHYLDEVDANASRAIVMTHGRIIADGPPAEIRKLAGVSTIRFSTDSPASELAFLAATADITVQDGRVSVRTAIPDATLATLVTGPVHWHNIEVAPPSLDDSFRLLTTDPS